MYVFSSIRSVFASVLVGGIQRWGPGGWGQLRLGAVAAAVWLGLSRRRDHATSCWRDPTDTTRHLQPTPTRHVVDADDVLWRNIHMTSSYRVAHWGKISHIPIWPSTTGGPWDPWNTRGVSQVVCMFLHTIPMSIKYEGYLKQIL